MIYFYEDKSIRRGFKPSWLDWEVPQDKDFIDLLELGSLYFPVIWCDKNGCHLFGYQVISKSNYRELGLSDKEYNEILNKGLRELAKTVNPLWEEDITLYPVVYRLTEEGLEEWELEGSEAVDFIFNIQPRKIEQELRNNLKDITRVIIENCLEFEYSNYERFKECVEDGIYTYFDQELPGIKEDYQDILLDLDIDIFQTMVLLLQEKILSKYFDDAKAIGYAIGVQHITLPRNYFLEYIVTFNTDNVEEADIKRVLEESGIEPYAWGISSNYNNWGNFWFGILTKEDLGNKELDEDLLVVLATQNPKTIIKEV